MLFSCSVSYRVTASGPLFRQFLMPFVPARGATQQRRACHRGSSLEKRVVLLILNSLEHPLCFELNLPDPLLRNIQLFTELCEVSRFTVVQPVPTHQYIVGSLR